jgi:DNA-binding CsgD family transcriptional regulator/PAS domain-containing protein
MSIDRALWDVRHRTTLLTLSGLLVGIIAVADWATKPYVSLGFLYLFPILASAAFLPRWALVLLGVGCAGLSARFSDLPVSWVRIGFEALALSGCGLFVHELSRNRQLAETNREQLRVLIGTSPAAIITVDHMGLVEQANEAAVDLLRPVNGDLIGSPIAAFIPELHYALRLEGGPQFRSALQCRAHRGDSESFTAEIWFSTYLDGRNPKLAAIIADMTDELSSAEVTPTVPTSPRIELTPREQEILSLVVQGLANKEIAEQINLSESSVKNCLQVLFKKTDVRSRSQLVRIALEQFRDQI